MNLRLDINKSKLRIGRENIHNFRAFTVVMLGAQICAYKRKIVFPNQTKAKRFSTAIRDTAHTT